MPAGQHNNEASWALCIEEGVVLGKFVGEQVFYGSTFLTYDMAHDGRQADTFSEGEEKRRVAPRGRTCCLWRSHVLPLEVARVTSRSLQMLPCKGTLVTKGKSLTVDSSDT